MLLFYTNKIEHYLAAFGVILATFLAVSDGLIWVLVVAFLYVAGVSWGVQLLHYFGIELKTIKQDNQVNLSYEESCGVCGGNGCKRHRPLVHSTCVRVPKDLDKALENLLEKLLHTYVCTWYSDLSTNEAFVQQLRLAIATAARNLTGRLLRADISNIIFHHLIPIALQHAQDWKAIAKRAKDSSNGSYEEFIAEHLGSRVHPAAYSRQAELEYLRGFVTALMPHLLPSTHISTNNRVILREILANWVLMPAIDALADPDNLNFLISLSTHNEGLSKSAKESVLVPMLQSWIALPIFTQTTTNPLKPSLEDILNDPQLLYLFMQHIKESGPMNLLQFCLDIDDLSKRMLNPDMTPEIEETLYMDALNIYSSYLDPDGPDFLHLPLHISMGMKEILEGGPSKVQDLRTSRPLYQAHQEAHALLEATCLPSFHHSYQLYNLLCGQPKNTPQCKSSSSQSSNVNTSSVGMGMRLGSQLGKIGGVLRASAVDGSPFQPHQVYQAEEVGCSPRTYNDSNSHEDKCRDLTTWRVSIPHVDGGGAQPLYMISVHSVSEEKSWTVLRRDQDFYALRTRLAEFHGDRELNDSPLPTRKNVSLIANRQRYQDFLQRLLAKPTLRSSELLYTFLTAPNLKPYSSCSSTADFGVLYQNVAHKLRKERGQHLDKFMSVFLASTNVKQEYMDVGIEPSVDQSIHDPQKVGRKLVSKVFGDNLHLNPQIQNFPYVTSKKIHVKGAVFCIAEAVDSLLNLPSTLSKILWMTVSFSRQSLDPIINKILFDTLVKLLSGGRAAIVVNLLHGVILGETGNADGTSRQRDKEEHYKSAKEGLHSILPWWFLGLHKQWCDLMDSLIEPLQCAPLNKHLAYMLLDHLLADLFPEVTS